MIKIMKTGFMMILSSCVMLIIYSSVWSEDMILELNLFTLNLNWSLMFFLDTFSKIFSLTVLTIYLTIFIYSIGYMSGEKETNLFYFILTSFVVSMLVLIFSFNLSSLLVGWDGLGVTSFLLIMYYHNTKSLSASLITMLINRMGDSLILFSLPCFLVSWTWNVSIYDKNVCITYSFFLMFAAFTKSAQFPFSSWLPLAMAAPTPVSSLVHSSTLVTAGAYLIFRYYEAMESWLGLACALSYITSILGSMKASGSWDLKEIVAYSTLSQVGFVIFSLSLGLKEAGFFHLITHAFFKSSLFMCSGVAIHMAETQDIRKVSFVYMSVTMKFSLLICVASMCGCLFTSGFYSKDFFLEKALFSLTSYTAWPCLYMSLVALTIWYTLSLIFKLCKVLGNEKLMYSQETYMSKAVWGMLWSSIIGGSVVGWVLIPLDLSYNVFMFKLVTYLSMFVGAISGFVVHMNYNSFFISMSMWFKWVVYTTSYNALIYTRLEKWFFSLPSGSLNKIYLRFVMESTWMMKMSLVLCSLIFVLLTY